MIVKIKRQHTADCAPYWQSFSYDGPMHTTVSAVLDFLNSSDELLDIEGNPAKKIKWECSCLQAVCGGCAMVINGIPALACNTFVDEVAKTELIIEPLSKFPVIFDLMVDRSIIYENLNSAKAYIESRSVNNSKEHEHQYSVAKCLKCGLCLEVCPNYNAGGTFYGALFANESYLIASQSLEKPAQTLKEYNAHFGAGCSKALSCQSVCPAKIETLTSILKMNRK